MGGGGLLQLVAYGAQDIYLTGAPQVTFFKVVYRRHTNFSMEAIEVNFNGAGDFGQRATITFPRNGDLVTKAYLRVVLPAVAATGTHRWVRHIGFQLLRYVEVEIGGQRIDKHYGEWLHIWNELTQREEKDLGNNEMIGDVFRLRGLPIDGVPLGAGTPETELHIPMQFWFNRNAGLALPLIAMQYHEVKMNFEFRPHSDLVDPNGTHVYTDDEKTICPSMYLDFVYLDTDERRRFAQVSHEYLIEQLQFNENETITKNNERVELNFNHPLKEIVWAILPTPNETQNQRTDYVYQTGGVANNYDFADDGLSGTPVNPLVDAKLQLNGHDRFSVRTARYFNLIQPHQHHTRVPVNRGIYVYSFALKPEDHQPSGSANLSRIDNAILRMNINSDLVSVSSGSLKLYATNYNVLRVMSGMSGLAYSN